MKGFLRPWIVRGLTLTLGASLALSGCTGGGKGTQTPKDPPAQPAPIVGGTLVQTNIGDAVVLLPVLVADSASANITGFLYDSLLTRDDNLNYLPSLAESYTIDQDKVYTFKLRKDVKFHDGQPLTSADVYFTFQTIAHPTYTGVRFGDFTGIKGWDGLDAVYTQADSDLKEKKIDEQTAGARKQEAYEKFRKEGGMSAPDPYTFRVELSEPFAPFLNNITGYGIMPKHLLEPMIGDLANAPEAKKPVGTGVMKFVEWVKDDHVTLVRNPEWKWGVKQKTANIDRMIFKVVPDMQANMVALENRETDTAAILPDNVEHFKQEVKHVNVLEYMTFNYTYLGYNLQDPRFSDVRVRKAITHAINRQEIVDKVLLGHGAVAHSHGNPKRWDYNPNVPRLDFDTAKAEALLDEAGWKKGPDGIRQKDGVKLEFEITTNSGNKIRENTAVIAQEALGKIGMKVTVNVLEFGALLQLMQSDKKQAYIMGWSIGFDPDSHSIWHSEGGFKAYVGYKNARVDDLLIQGRKFTDLNLRKEIYGEVQKILAEDQPYSFLFFQNSIQGVNARVAGLPKDAGPAGLVWNFEEWYLLDAVAR